MVLSLHSNYLLNICKHEFIEQLFIYVKVMYDATGVRLHAGRQAEVRIGDASANLAFMMIVKHIHIPNKNRKCTIIRF